MELPRALSGSKELMACPRVASPWTVPTGGSPPGAFDWAGKVAAPATQNKRMAIAKCFQDIAHSSFHAADSNREPLKTIAVGQLDMNGFQPGVFALEALPEAAATAGNLECIVMKNDK